MPPLRGDLGRGPNDERHSGFEGSRLFTKSRSKRISANSASRELDGKAVGARQAEKATGVSEVSRMSQRTRRILSSVATETKLCFRSSRSPETEIALATVRQSDTTRRETRWVSGTRRISPKGDAVTRRAQALVAAGNRREFAERQNGYTLLGIQVAEVGPSRLVLGPSSIARSREVS